MGQVREAIFETHTHIFERVRLLVHVFYWYLFGQQVFILTSWNALLSREGIDPLWPLYWLHFVDVKTGILAVLISYLVGTLLAALWPGLFWTRLAAFVGMLFYCAFDNSFGKIGHGMHLMVWISFVFLFLPSGWNGERSSRVVRQKSILLFWIGQVVILLSYSMAGFIKLLASFTQLVKGEPSIFSIDCLSRTIAHRLMQTDSVSMIGTWLIDRPLLGWLLYWGAIYLELFALWAIFRPSLQKMWAAGLLLFHLGVFFTMTILFHHNFFLLMMFFFLTPLYAKKTGVREITRDLPPWCFLMNIFPSRKRKLRW